MADVLRERHVAVTIDDLPVGGGTRNNDLEHARRINTSVLRALRKHDVPAIGFVNESKLYIPGELDERVALLEMWLDAGMTLGNHTFSHLGLQETPLPLYQDDVIKGEVVTRHLMESRGRTFQYFRHPYTQTGPSKEIKTAFEQFLHQRGYRTAPFTIEHADYAFNRVYVQAREQMDETLVARVKEAYLAHLDTMFGYFEGLSQDLFGREIMQIFLIHANEINADCLDDMLAALKSRGYAFVSIDEALEDSAYSVRDEYVGPVGASWLHRWSISKGVPVKTIRGKAFPGTVLTEPDPPSFIVDQR